MGPARCQPQLSGYEVVNRVLESAAAVVRACGVAMSKPAECRLLAGQGLERGVGQGELSQEKATSRRPCLCARIQRTKPLSSGTFRAAWAAYIVPGGLLRSL